MRTNQEILDRIEERKDIDVFGFETSDLIARLDFELAKEFLNPEHRDGLKEQWEPLPRDRESILAQMLDYMPFAWGKANDERGLSASRSMFHYMAWVWLAGDDLGELTDYEFYGKDNLVKICEHYGWDHTRWDDGVRTN